MRIGIIGGGISGLMAAYSLLKNNKDCTVTIIEKGSPLQKRECPILSKKQTRCVKCKKCAIMNGMAGAGAFSDGKYNITTEFGGWLQDIKPKEDVIRYIEEADSILVKLGATTHRFMPNNELKKKCLEQDLHMLQSECKHLGTDANYDTMVSFIKEINKIGKNRLNIITNATVCDIDKEKNIVVYSKNNNTQEEHFDFIIIAVGRSGSSFFASWCNNNNIKLRNNQIDIGVRVELPSEIWSDFEEKIYEPKISYRSKKYGDTTRMFCFNGRGEVVTENTDGILTVNGHAYKEESKKTENTNFALLCTIHFTEPFNEPIAYVKHIAKLANMISHGGVLVQRLGDLEKGRRSNKKRMSESTVKPTLKGAVAGDLSLCLPKRQLDNIIETLHALDKIAPGTANEDTLLYGIECKYYSARPECNDDFSLKNCKNIYAIGDGAGFTRSLAQAAAQGLMVADFINKKKN